jgi:hypothetical protein
MWNLIPHDISAHTYSIMVMTLSVISTLYCLFNVMKYFALSLFCKTTKLQNFMGFVWLILYFAMAMPIIWCDNIK